MIPIGVGFMLLIFLLKQGKKNFPFAMLALRVLLILKNNLGSVSSFCNLGTI